MKNNNPSNKFKKHLKDNVFTRFLGSLGRIIDLLFSKNITLIILSILTASALYVYVIDLPSQLELKSLETRTLEDVKIEIVNNDKAKVIEVYDQDGSMLDSDEIYADIIIKGPRNEILKMVNNKDYKFFIDTNEIKDGEEKDMQVSVDNKPENVIVSTSPSNFNIKAHKRVVRDDLTLKVEAVNIDKMGNNLSVENIEIPTAKAQVSGSREKVDSVATIKALVNVESIKVPGQVELGNDSVNYRAYDLNGDTVDVSVDVKQKGATVTVNDYGKQVPVKINFTGDLPEGQSISNYELSVDEVYIYGEKDKLSDIDDVVIDIKVSDIKNNSSLTVNIPKPEGVISLSEDKVNIKVNFEETVTKTVNNVPVQSVNLDSNYAVQSAEGELLLSVELTGAKSVLDNITVEDIILQVDLSGLSSGKHTVTVEVSDIDSRVGYQLSKQKVEVEIYKP